MKHFFWIITLILLFAPWEASALELIRGPEVTQISPNQAKVTWKTNTQSGSRVLFGTSEAQLISVRAEGVTDAHELILDSLKPNTSYVIKVGSARVILATIHFTPGESSLNSTQEGSKEKANAPPSKLKAPRVTSASEIQVPPVKQSWNRMSTLQDHYDRHGPDFGSSSPEDYANSAYVFLIQAIQQNLPAKFDAADDTLRIFDAKTKTFAAYTKTGRTRTFFKPQSPTYFQRQPGTSVNLRAHFGLKK